MPRSRSRRLTRAVLAAAALTLAVGLPAQATFSGPDGRITFARYVPETNGLEIFSAAANGSDVQQLTNSGQDHSSRPSDWSPNGNVIAFDSDRVDRAGLEDSVQVYVMPWNGESQGLTQLTVGEGFHGDPAWAPDGTHLAIDADWGDYPAQQGIWIIPAASATGVTIADAQRVTGPPAAGDFDSEPQYSPDGQWIVFTRFHECPFNPHARVFAPKGCTQAIYKVRTDGSGLTRLTAWGQENSAPDWSPDGSRIAYDSCDVGRIGCTADIYLMNADGSHKLRLSHTQAVTAQHGGTFAIANNPVWSSAGDRIIYSQWIGSGFPVEIRSMNADGSGVATLVAGDYFQNWADAGTHQ
jgi:Tol biopolymer transport system component